MTTPRIRRQTAATSAARPAGILDRLIRTDSDSALLVLRVSLAVILFPHGAQHMVGWFGGYGFAGTHQWMTEILGFPSALAALAIITEFFAPFALLAGALSRLAAMGVIGLMIGAISTHVEHGFFMNWFGTLPAGAEGYEYHLLVIAIAVAILMRGSGARSIDLALSSRGAGSSHSAQEHLMGDITIMTAGELKARLGRGPVPQFWNVLTDDYYSGETIPGSRRVPVDQVGREISRIGIPKETEIVVYCSGPTCPQSRAAAEKLRDLGFSLVFLFEGGIEAWKEAGYEIEAEAEVGSSG